VSTPVVPGVDLSGLVCQCGSPVENHNCPLAGSSGRPGYVPVTVPNSNGKIVYAPIRGRCNDCGGKVHRNDGAVGVALQCLWLQWSRYHNNDATIPDSHGVLWYVDEPVSPSTIAQFSQWCSTYAGTYKGGVKLPAVSQGYAAMAAQAGTPIVRARQPRQPSGTKSGMCAACGEVTLQKHGCGQWLHGTCTLLYGCNACGTPSKADTLAPVPSVQTVVDQHNTDVRAEQEQPKPKDANADVDALLADL